MSRRPPRGVEWPFDDYNSHNRDGRQSRSPSKMAAVETRENVHPSMNSAPSKQTAPQTFAGRLVGTRRRKAVAALICVLTVAVILLGIQSWRVLSAIVKVENAAIVPLPPSDTAILTPTAEPQTIAELNPAVVGQTRPSTSGAERTTPARVPTDRSTGDNAEGTESQADPSLLASPDDQGSDHELSRLDVARQLVEAGIDGSPPGSSEIWNGREGITVLILGVDRRSDGGDQNADVIIIAHLDLQRQRLSGVSLPRDLLVDIPGVGPDKINGAYNYGVLESPDDPVAGVAKVRDTVESAFGVRIDGYILVDFTGFTDVVNALGGIDVDVPYQIVDTEYPTEDYGIETVTFDAGPQEMDGDDALKYVRTRHADSDDARRERQLDVIRAIFDRGKSISSVANADEIVLAAGDTIQTSFGLEEQLTLARLALEMEPQDIRLTTLGEPLLESGWTDDGRWVYIGDHSEIQTFIAESLRTDLEFQGDGAPAG